jgi:hypothetical protein
MKFVLPFLLLFGSAQVLADNYYVRELKSPGVAKDDVATITELIKNAVESTGNHVVDTENGAKYALRSKILKLGGAYILTVDKVRDSKTQFSTQLKAEHFEELDNVVSRVIRSVIKEVAIVDNGTVHDVTENEAIQGTRRKDTVNRWYIGMGPGTVSHVNSTRTLFDFSLGYFFEIDPEWALKIIYDGTGSNFSYLALGTNYYFTDKRSSPMATMHLGYGSASIDTDSWFHSDTISGFVVGGGVGYQFFRTSKVNLELLLSADVLTQANSLGTPAKFGFRVGIYW